MNERCLKGKKEPVAREEKDDNSVAIRDLGNAKEKTKGLKKGVKASH